MIDNTKKRKYSCYIYRPSTIQFLSSFIDSIFDTRFDIRFDSVDT